MSVVADKERKKVIIYFASGAVIYISGLIEANRKGNVLVLSQSGKDFGHFNLDIVAGFNVQDESA